MFGKVNCKYNDRGAWCTNKNIKRSLFGIGAKCCVEYEGKECQYKEEVLVRPPTPRGQIVFAKN